MYYLFQVTALPDISLYERHEGDELLVLGCDGIWDVMTNEECSTEILRLICEEVFARRVIWDSFTIYCMCSLYYALSLCLLGRI